MRYQDYYKTLGVERSATQDEIHKAYRKLARKLHPDVNKEKEAEDKFKSLGEAYEVLKDPERRRLYDELGTNMKAGQEFKVPPGWEGGFHFDTGGASGFAGAGFSDFFEAIFGQQGHGFASGQDIFEGLSRGAGGTRKTRHAARASHFEGADDGKRYDIVHELNVSPWEAALGTQLTLKLSSGGTVKVNIPAGSQSGQQLRLKGKGLNTPDGQRGDLFLKIRITVPKELTPGERELFEKLQNASRFNPRARGS